MANRRDVAHERPAAFLSYVHFDDDLDRGQITKLADRLSLETQAATAEEFHIFRDRKDIEWGQNWLARIEKSLATSTFLIPIITPSFFRSDMCLHELESFLERERMLERSDLILPIYYIHCPFLHTNVDGDDKRARWIRAIAERQYKDWRPLRLRTSTSLQVRKAIAELAVDIREALEGKESKKTHSDSALRPSTFQLANSPRVHRPYRILHIADLHFCKANSCSNPSQQAQRQAERLAFQLQSSNAHSAPFDLIAFSGDFTYSCRTEGLVTAATFVNVWAELLNCTATVIVPGDHDLGLGRSVAIGNLSLPPSKNEVEVSFRDFLSKVRHVSPPNYYLSSAVRLERGGARGLAIIGLNAFRVQGRDAQGYAYVGADQIYDAAQGLIGGMKKGDIIIAITHKNPLPTADAEVAELARPQTQRRFDLFIDACGVLDFLSDLGVCALLHGHVDTPSTKLIKGYGFDLERQEFTLLTLGTGAFHKIANAKGKPHERNQCRILEIGSDGHLSWQHLDWPAVRTESLDSSASVPRTDRDHTILAFWDDERTARVLKSRKLPSMTTTAAYEIMQSWSVLRDKVDRPSDWHQVLLQLHQRVTKIEPTATLEFVVNTIEDLLSNPPAADILRNWSLEEYLLLAWRGRG